GRIKSVQALIIPVITGKTTFEGKSTASGGGYGRSGGGGGQIDFMVHTGSVAATVRVIDTTTGKLLRTVAPDEVKRTQGTAIIPPDRSGESLAEEAARIIA